MTETEKQKLLINSEKPNRNAWVDYDPKREYTTRDVITEIGFGNFQVIWILVIGCSFIAGAAVIQLQAIWSSRLYIDMQLTPFQQSFLRSTSLSGLIFSSAFFGWLCDRIGRKNSLILSNALLLFWNLMTCVWENYAWILVMRFLLSISKGQFPYLTIQTGHNSYCKKYRLNHWLF